MRRPFSRPVVVITDHHTRLEIAVNQRSHPIVLDSLSYQAYQFIVIHPVKELLQIQVYHPSISPLDVCLSADNGLVRRTARAKTKTVIRKRTVPLGLQNL